MVEKIPMTAAGYSALETELKHCQQTERPRIIAQISDARTHGVIRAKVRATHLVAGHPRETGHAPFDICCSARLPSPPRAGQLTHNA